MTKIPNIGSPNGIKHPCSLLDLDGWINSELTTVSDPSLVELIKLVLQKQSSFICWPKEAILLWPGAFRQQGHYPKYPQKIKDEARTQKVTLDARSNGPAVMAYAFAKGARPWRFGSNNQWSVHHLYSGKYPYIGKKDTLHAVKSGVHFTQSAGLVATHPILDALFDEIPAISWYFRANAFKLFGYDPDNVFSNKPKTEFGFSQEGKCRVIYEGGAEVIAA